MAPGVPDPAPPAGCRKSTNGYPSILARRLNAPRFIDVTCSGATTENITGRAQQTSDRRTPEPQLAESAEYYTSEFVASV